MNEYPLIKSMNLTILEKDGGFYVSATLLEKALQDAPVVYGIDDGITYSKQQLEWHKQEARLVCVQPIKRKTKAEAALELVTEMANNPKKFWDVSTLEEAKRILEMEE